MKKTVNYLLSAVILFGALFVGVVMPTSLVSATQDGIIICHRTNSPKNPYISKIASGSDIDGQGNNDHTLHQGPVATSEAVAQALKDNKQNWGDIIPNVLNWTQEGQTVYNNNCGNGEQELDEVVPAAVTFTDATCDKSGFYTVPTTEHVTYTVNGSEVAAGDYDVANGSSVTVVAVADEGFFIADETTDTWTHEFSTPSGCGEVLSEQVTKTPKGAANAGAGGGSVMTGSLIGLVSSAFLGLAGFLGRKWSLNQ